MTRKNNPTKTGTNWLYGLITSCLLILVFPVSLYFNLNFFVTRFAEGLAIDQQGNLYIAEEDVAHVENTRQTEICLRLLVVKVKV